VRGLGIVGDEIEEADEQNADGAPEIRRSGWLRRCSG
jgi:hypothetical protein